MVASVLVVQNSSMGGPGRFGEWLEEDGLTLDVIHPYAGQTMPGSLAGYRALLILGGSPMPDDDERMPWLADSRALAREALDAGLPYFGICQGAQLLALVAGGTVKASHGEPEVGSTGIALRAAAARDALFGGLPEQVTAIERHVDQITELPPGAVWLAESERCPVQAFRYGSHAWGVQFHPEVTAARLKDWDEAKLRVLGYEPAELIRRAEREEPAALRTWRDVARRFAAEVWRLTPAAPARP